MIFALISDIHGNLTALETALKYIQSTQVDKIYCLGDIVGYGPRPNECVQLVREQCDCTLMGNHDYAAIGLQDITNFNSYARYSMEWTRENLTDESKSFLKKLPFSFHGDDFILVHASPKSPSYWNYVLHESQSSDQLQAFKQFVCFIGHTHIPVIFSSDKRYSDNSLMLNPDEKYIVNVGSVGQPRDHNPKSCLVIYDTEKHSVEYIRLAYNIKKTQDEIRSAGLPDYLADRLTKGI